MATFKRFEEIVAWQEARKLAANIYALTRKGDFARDFGLRDQITRAAVSVMNNIAEGFGRHNAKEFARFLEIGKGSLCEVQSMSYIALDNGYFDAETQTKIYKMADSTAALISGLTNYLRKSVSK